MDEKRLWRPKFTLRSHLDSVRTLEFHPNDLCVATASEDGSIKYWNMESLASMKKFVLFIIMTKLTYRPSMDFEPFFTFRGHRDSVNALALSTMIPPSVDGGLEKRLQHGVLYSAGDEGFIRMWSLPDKNQAPYSKYGRALCFKLISNNCVEHRQHAIAILKGHTDVIWSLKLHPLRPLLVSGAADATIKLWDLNTIVSSSGSDGCDLLDASSSLKSTLCFNGVLSGKYILLRFLL